MEINIRELFTETVSSLFVAHQAIGDLFFKNRVGQEIQGFLKSHIDYKVAQVDSAMRKDALFVHIRSCKDVSNALETLSYLKIGSLVPSAIAQEKVLYYLQQVILDAKEEVLVVAVSEVPRELISQKIKEQGATVTKPPKLSKRRKNDNKNKILDFVRRAPETRTREIIEEFSVLSERTVKRTLKELREEGLIVKKADNGAVFYSAV